jgi:hypothetical protein
MTVAKIQGKTMPVDNMKVMAAVAVVTVLDQVARIEVFDPTKAPKSNRRRINVEEFTAARADVKQQSADWS